MTEPVVSGALSALPPTVEAQAMQALLAVLQSSTSPDVLQAQAIMLRRLALEGDVAASRIPAPLNITEVGGYLNLLTTLGQTNMRNQALAGALGVAGSIEGIDIGVAAPSVAWVTMPDDRPPGPAQGIIPLTFQSRSDFSPALQVALQALHDQGCSLPILAPVQSLPSTAPTSAAALLPLIGRAFSLVPGTALTNPDADPIAVAQLNGGPWQVVARCLATGPVGVQAHAWTALTCTPSSCTPSPAPAAGRRFVPLAPILASAGFVPASAGYAPTSLTDYRWAQFVNLTGLVPGVTTLGSELSLLWSPAQIAASGLAGQTANVWNGSAFAAH